MNDNQVFFLLCLGSNEKQEYHVKRAKVLLHERFDNLLFSKELLSKPIGIQSPDFLNTLACGYTTMKEDELIGAIKAIEHQLLSTKEEHRRGLVRIDIDLLQYGDKRMRPDDWERPYVRELLNDLTRKNPATSECLDML